MHFCIKLRDFDALCRRAERRIGKSRAADSETG